MLHTGIDLHKRTAVLTTVDADGHVIAEATLRTRRPALARYFAALPGPHEATVEATSGWYWVRDLLAREGVTLRLAHAKFVKAIAYAKVKTDAVDAHTLAQLLRAGLIPEAHMISPELQPLRDVMRTRLRLVQKEVGVRNSIHRLLEKHNVRSVADLPPLAQLQAACHREQVALLREQIRRLEKSLHPHLVPDPDVQRLLAIPGIGKVGAFTLVLEIDGIARFPSERRFFSYCRLVPGAANSGGRTRTRPSRDGNKYLKLMFSNAAVRAIQYYPEIRDWYARKARKKNRHVARALVAKEIARIVYHVLSQQEDFNQRFKGTPLQRRKKQEWPRRSSPGA
ncbi:MAG: IS110 family transposase [Gemmatimonadota bacterium]|jgi:transposase